MKRTIVFVTMIMALAPVVVRATNVVDVRPGANLQAQISSAGPGTTFQLGAGVYTLDSTVTLVAGQSLVGAGPGVTILDGGGADIVGLDSSKVSGVAIKDMTVRGFSVGINEGDAAVVKDVEAGPNTETGVLVTGDNASISGSSVHDNGRFGIYVNGASDTNIEGNTVAHNHTASAWDNGYAGGIKVINGSRNVVIQGNTVTDTQGRGIWTDGSARGTQIIGNTVLRSTEEGIRLEKSYDTLVDANTTDTGIRSLDSSGGLVQHNIVSAPPSIRYPLSFAGNGAGGPDGEYTNTNNRAYANVVSVAGKQKVGVVRTAGTTSGNSFDADNYVLASPCSKWLMWWDGTNQLKLDWNGWRGVGQDANGTVRA
ncbi:MAG TPA: right-handed parallel beta-helix repeat-containing protein [Actinomycetota bacterium]|jgi:parallel beta-helix repeat protein|nr:right-handed parallel beta-helix repeat-containing protein [Actinomycetota bacterium]